MRLSHTELASCLSDPGGWVTRRRTGSSIRTLGYDQILKLGIVRFHKLGGLATAAREHMNGILGRQTRLRNEARKEDLFSRYDAYVDWCEQADLTVGGLRTRIRLEIADSLTLTGEVTRVDVVTRGYRGVLLGRHARDWQDETRMPLLQLALAEALARPVDEVAVGVQDLDGAGLETRLYSPAAIGRAKRTVRALGKRLGQYLSDDT